MTSPAWLVITRQIATRPIALRRVAARQSSGKAAIIAGCLLTLVACSGGEPGSSSPTGPIDTPAPVLTSLSSDMLVEGSSFVIRGANFSPTRSSNRVTIDSEVATVTAASSTELSVTVPSFDCRPQRTVSVLVTVNGKSSSSASASVIPASFVDSAPGELLLFEAPSGFCLQFGPAAAGAGEYLVGIGSAAEMPSDMLEVSMVGSSGQAAPGATLVSPASVTHAGERSPRSRGPQGTPRADTRWESHFRAEQRIRQWERSYFDASFTSLTRPVRDASQATRVTGAAAIPSVGDQLDFNVPNFDDPTGTLAGACTPVPITTRVRFVGERGIFVSDINNPQADALTDAEIESLSDDFDSFIYSTDTRYFGPPVDLDENEHILIVFTIELNKVADGEAGAVVWIGDFFSPELCPASNLAEMYYSGVPDPGNVAGTRARPKAEVTDYFSQVLAHEFVHILQNSNRFRLDGPTLSAWEAEGQAMLGTEVVGHAALGLQAGQNYGAATALSGPAADWYEGHFLSLATYLGYDDAGGRNTNTPESCTLLFQNVFAATGCEPGSGYGAAWSFFRFLADRYGPDWPGGREGLMTDLIDDHPTLRGVANIEAVLGRPFDEIFAEWAAMQYADDRVTNADPALLMNSWDLPDILTNIDANATLLPTARAFSDFSVSTEIRGGSMAYSLFSDATPRPAMAIRVRGPGNAVLSDAMRPHVWVMRTR